MMSILAVVFVSGCGDNSDSSENSHVTSVEIENRGAVTSSATSTNLTFREDLIECAKERNGIIVEKWSRRIRHEDFLPAREIVEGYSLFDEPDVVCKSGEGACEGWRGMTITMERAGTVRLLEIDGSLCGRDQWPEGVRRLVEYQDSIMKTKSCPSYVPPDPDWCADGTIIPPAADENGCYGPPQCRRVVGTAIL